jgi:hypothetical protein
MRLDIRLPLGLLFVVFGVLLSGFGLISDQALYQRSIRAGHVCPGPTQPAPARQY